jgi:hypothetical protein
MAMPLAPNATSVGLRDKFSGNFTKALYLRSQSSNELERRIGYGSGRLAKGWWLLFALEKPSPANFQFGGYTHFSGARIGPPSLGNARPTVEESLKETLGGNAALMAQRTASLAALQLTGPERLAKIIPVAGGADYPVGTGIYQCNVGPGAILCVVAAFIPPGGMYTGMYT